MKRILAFTFAFCLFTFAFASASDDCIPAKPSPQHLVNNLSLEFPDFLSADEEQALENKLVQFNNETSNQIAIVIIDDMCGYEASDFAFRLGDKWGIGQKDFKNGILILIKPTGGAGQRDEGIAVGYGLEGAIPDIITQRIRKQEMIPRFKEGQYYEGLDDATNVLMALAKGEFTSDEYAKNKSQGMPWFLIVSVILFVILSFVFRNKKGQTISSGRTYYGGGFSSWGGGGFGGGSSGGGGFGGFGGGGFGGGGSFGKW